MMCFIENIDKQATIFLNNMHCDILDFVMYHISHLYCAVPIYIAVITAYIVFKREKSRIYILFAILSLVMVLIVVNFGIKPYFARIRPINSPDIAENIITIKNYTATGFSFVSSHAAISFAIATFATFCLQKKTISTFLFAWAIIYSYSRVYLGVHFLGDVLCGAILGTLIAYLFYWLMKKTKTT